MKRTLHHFAAMALIAIVALICGSCASQTDDLLETVPADCDYVVVMDAKTIMSALGITIDGDMVSLPEQWQKAAPRLSDADRREAALGARALDISRAVFFQIGGDTFLTLRITDPKAFDQLVADVKPETTDGYRVYEHKGNVWVVKGDQLWMLNGRRAAERVKAVVSRAADEKAGGSVARLSGVTGALNADKAMRAAVSLSRISGDEKEDLWATAAIDVQAKLLAADVQIMEPQGQVRDIPGLTTLSTDFLRYTPASANFVAAAGIGPDFNWDIVANIFSAIPDPQLSGMLGTVMPYLRKADGTAAVAASIDADDLSASGRTFLFMVHMPQAEVDAALADIESRMRSMGADPQRSREGVISLPGFYAGNVDGYLAVSSRPFSPTASNDLNTYFLSRRAAIYVDLPRLPMFEQPVAVRLNVEVETQTVRLRLASSESLQQIIAFLLSSVI